ncbi:serine/arginine-rich splicing factor SC35-like [Camellia sinensis]|uniref:serine/arginine-rich splicing factor SC35-like n=1 Tax=Camellia sinensis TaxID=4442 RepID=UPI0010366443|nr:serine/arginine-rich splicing factor SC35-like [Camellia sinensis]
MSQWRGGGAQSKERSQGFFTVFVDNIPTVMDAKALYKLFTKFGIVKGAYIPFKRRKVTNTRFGFVRYDCRISASVAIQKANGLFVDDMMLVVKMATYDRNTRPEQSNLKHWKDYRVAKGLEPIRDGLEAKSPSAVGEVRLVEMLWYTPASME